MIKLSRYLLSTLLWTSLFIVSAFAGEISIHGSTTVFTNVFKQHENTIESKSGVQLKIIANGSGRGIADLLDGKANMAMISAPLETTVAKINKKSPGRVPANVLVGHQIGETRIAFIVHGSNPVQELSLEQVKGILTGKIKNWKQVGGPAKPIIVIAEDAKGGIRALVEKKVLGGKEISAPGKKEVPNGSQVAKVTSQIPLAFGVSSPASVSGSAKILKTDKEIVQPLLLVTKGETTADMNKVIAEAKAVAPN